jgi:cysteine-rich repeat protein
VTSSVGASSCSGSYVVGYCGDGLVNGPESCDDGNLIDTDNCKNSCQGMQVVEMVSCSDLLVNHVMMEM